MSKQRNIIVSTAATILVAASLTVSAPAQSSDAGAFIGGIAAARIGANMRRRTEAQLVACRATRATGDVCTGSLIIDDTGAEDSATGQTGGRRLHHQG